MSAATAYTASLVSTLAVGDVKQLVLTPDGATTAIVTVAEGLGSGAVWINSSTGGFIQTPFDGLGNPILINISGLTAGSVGLTFSNDGGLTDPGTKNLTITAQRSEAIASIIALLKNTNPTLAAISGSGPWLDVAPENVATPFKHVTYSIDDIYPNKHAFNGAGAFVEKQALSFHVWSQEGAAVCWQNTRVIANFFNRRSPLSDGTNASQMFLRRPIMVKRERYMGPGGLEVYHGIAAFGIMVQQPVTN